MNYDDLLLAAPFIELETLPVHDTKQWDKRDPSKLKGAVVHQSLEEYGTASGNAKYHVGPNHISEDGLPGLSYTIFVERKGRVILANSTDCKTYSQGYAGRPGDENEEFLSICVGGNFSAPGYTGTQTPTEDQMQLLVKTWEHLKSIWGWTDRDLYGHYHFGKSTCPGDVLRELIENIRPLSFTTASERQTALLKLGFYKGDLDGIWGPMSKAALVEFQKKAGLVPDGVWSDRTTEAVKTAMGV